MPNEPTRPTGTANYSVPSVWSPTFAMLKNTDWSDEDVHEIGYDKGEGTRHHIAALALQYAYAKVGNGEDGVLATLKATREHANGMYLSPVDVADMADNFAAMYDSFDEPLSDHLRENYNNLSPDWLNERGRKHMESEIVRDSEIWIDEAETGTAFCGVWVFNKPHYF